MKHKSILRMFTAAVLCCTLCGSGLTVPAFSADENEELPAKFDLRDEGAMTPAKRQSHNGCELYAGYAAIESRMIKQGMADASLDLSEDHCLWFTCGKGKSEDPDDPLFGDGKDRGTEGYQRQIFMRTSWQLSGVGEGLRWNRKCRSQRKADRLMNLCGMFRLRICKIHSDIMQKNGLTFR
ncbi:MAG: hypothetical protein IKQ91_02110 [Oscillospiraceae bacterium]|nr:hypothetical protein [Oscillospiraceae bacterium]